MGDEDDPRSSCGRRALGRPINVAEEPAGELESKGVEGDLERFMESDDVEGEDPATGEAEPILRS